MKKRLPESGGEEPEARRAFLLYTAEDGRTRIDCRFDGQTIWLTQAQIAELFQTSVTNINLHLKAVYAEGETRLSDWLTFNERKVLPDVGTVSRAQAETKAVEEHDKFHARRLKWEEQASAADFEDTMRRLPKPSREKPQ